MERICLNITNADVSNDYFVDIEDGLNALKYTKRVHSSASEYNSLWIE